MNKKFLVALLVFIPVLFVYVYSMVPAITQDDSGELSGDGITLGTAHSPGYPLYCMVSKVFVTVIPLGNKAYRVNLVSAVGIAAAAAVVTVAAFEISASFIAALVIGFSFSFSSYVWNMANVTEVYGIAAVLASLIWFIILRARFIESGKITQYLYGIMFVFGAGLTGHYTLGLLAPGILCWVVFNRDRLFSKSWRSELLKALLWSFAGCSSVLYLYVRANQNPVFGWEDPKTLERFWQVIARLRYGAVSLAQGGPPPLSPEIVIGKLWFYAKELYGNYSWWGTALFCAGVYRYAKDKKFGWPLFMLVIGSGPGFVLLANVGLDAASKELMERFLFLSFLFSALIMAGGISLFPKPVKMLSMFLPALLLWQNYPVQEHRQEYMYYDYGKSILKTVPPNSLLLADRADEMEFAVAYLHLAQKLRPDIKFIDCNAGITKSIYGDNYYRIWGKPRLELRERTERDMIANYPGPVYYATFLPKMINIPRVREGLLFRAKPLDGGLKNFPYDEVCCLRVQEPPHFLEGRLESLIMSYYDLLGEYSLESGLPDKAGLYFAGVSAYDDTGKWDSALAYIYHAKGFTKEALEYYKKAAAKGAASPGIYVNMGAIQLADGQVEQAKKSYLTAIFMSPEDIQAHYNLAVLYWKQADWPEVVKEFKKVIELDPANQAARQYLAVAMKRSK